jgi:hypothetical protein
VPSADAAALNVVPVVTTSSTSTPATGKRLVENRGGRRSEPLLPARCDAHSGALNWARTSIPLIAAIARANSSAGSTPNRQARRGALGMGTSRSGGGPHRSTSAAANSSAAGRIPSYLSRCTSARAGPAWRKAAFTTSPPGRYRSGAGARAARHPPHRIPAPQRRQARQVMASNVRAGGDRKRRRKDGGRRKLLPTSGQANGGSAIGA